LVLVDGPWIVYTPVVGSYQAASVFSIHPDAVRLWEPLTVAFAESVMVAVKLLIVWIVVPYGMPVPVTGSPTNSPVVLLRPVTDADPLVSVPVKVVDAIRLWEPLAVAFAESVTVAVELSIVWIVVPDGMPVPVTVCPTTSPVVLLMPVTDADPFISVPVKVVL